MEFLPIIPQVGKHAMNNLRDTIHENEELNKQAHQIRMIVINFLTLNSRPPFEKNL